MEFKVTNYAKTTDPTTLRVGETFYNPSSNKHYQKIYYYKTDSIHYYLNMNTGEFTDLIPSNGPFVKTNMKVEVEIDQ